MRCYDRYDDRNRYCGSLFTTETPTEYHAQTHTMSTWYILLQLQDCGAIKQVGGLEKAILPNIIDVCNPDLQRHL